MKTIRIIFCALFFAVCAFPAVSMFFSEQDASVERREETELPEIVVNGKLNQDFGDGVESYVSEHFGFRAELVTANNALLSGIFGVSGENKVIVGKDGWLFLEETAEDYQGVKLLSEREIYNIARSIRLTEEYVRSDGLEFVFAVAPNKNTLYGGFMPYYYVEGDFSNLERLNAQLEKLGVSYVDLYGVLSGYDEVLYHKRDTHWNNKGAFIAVNEILESTGFEKIPEDFGWVLKKDYTGDLEHMIYPVSGYKDYQYYPDNTKLIENFRFEKNRGSVESPDFVTSSLDEKDGSILFFRDSFANAVAPFLSSHVGNVRYQKYIPYQINLIEREKYDAVVIEIAERNLPELLKAAPKVPAKVVTLSGNAVTTSEPCFTLTRENSGNYAVFEGTVDSGFIDVTTDIYILVENNSSTYVFEAFPVGENGFSAMIEENLVENGAAVRVVLKNGGELNILENQK